MISGNPTEENVMDIEGRVNRIVDCLRSVINSVGCRWSSNLQTGWREFPDESSDDLGPSVDVWSTSQALEILACLLMKFRANGYLLSTGLEEKGKRAILTSLDPLLKSSSNYTRLQSGAPSSTLCANEKPDVIGLVWELRALSQMLKASSVLSLPTDDQTLLRRGEEILRDLFVLQDPNGAWSSFGWVGRSSYVTGMVVWTIAESYSVFEGLRYLRPHKVHGTHIAVEWILKNRVPGSGIPFFEGGTHPSISRTAIASIAVCARAKLKCTEQISGAELAMNNAWILECQDLSGGWYDNLETRRMPDVETTALAVLALLESGTMPSHPSICRAVDWILSSFRINDDGRSGWGIYFCADADPKIRIWTTWYAVLALWEFVSKTRTPLVEFPKYQVCKRHRPVFVEQGCERLVRIPLHVKGQGTAWCHMRINPPYSEVELGEPSIVQIEESKSHIDIRLRLLRKGLVRCSVAIYDLASGRFVSVPLRIIAPGRFYRSMLRTLADARVVVTGIAASSAVYAFLKLESKITKELAVHIFYIGLGALAVVALFAIARYFSKQ